MEGLKVIGGEKQEEKGAGTNQQRLEGQKVKLKERKIEEKGGGGGLNSRGKFT